MRLTIFTPTYNRSHLLINLFNSLQSQTSHDFEWLIIDDGSTDDTRNTVLNFQNTSQFPIQYYWKENGGKHSAYNMALKKAKGLWFVCVDSDDLLSPNAISTISQLMTVQTDNKGIIAYKINTNGDLLSSELPYNINSMYLYELGIKYGCTGDYLFALETTVARQHPFPIFSGETFMPESVVWDGLKDTCRFTVIRESLMICEYQPNGYSNNFARLMQQNPCGFCLCFLQRIDLQVKLLPRIIHAGKYWCFRWISKNKTLTYNGNHKFLVAFSVIPGAIFRIYYKLFRKI